ncbi:MAG: DUF420 domain-containing protein [Elusimicrobia bacterium]|nr:DUF420 domain-containing protein [Elusimicrobiota bacterium]
MPLSSFPGLIAGLNAAAAVLLVLGWVLIKSGRREAHRWAMVSAFLCSAVFLGAYLWYHAHAGVVRYRKAGPIRLVYFAILLTHTVLAAAVPVLAVETLFLAWRGRFDAHRRWARWTLPIWLYVSVTGVVVYWMLFRS